MRGILLLAFLLFSRAGQAQDDPDRHHARRLFETVKSGDGASYLALFPSHSDMLVFLRASRPMDFAQLRQMDSAFTPKVYADLLNKELERFRKFRQRAEERGLHWPSAELDSFKTDTQHVHQERTGVRMLLLEGELFVHDSAGRFALRFTDAAWLEEGRRWFGANWRSVERTDKKREEEEDVIPVIEQLPPSPRSAPPAKGKKS